MSLYLILHKVRGEPAFDIAHRLQIGDEEGWIIPTSGHRAYPYFTQPLHEIVQEDLFSATLPADLRDHYELEREPTTVRKSLSALLGRIMPPKDPLRVRRLDE